MSDRQLLRAAILTSLNECGTYLLPEGTLLMQVKIRCKPAPFDSEIRDEIRALDSDGSLTVIADRVGVNRVGITAEGKAALQSLLY